MDVKLVNLKVALEGCQGVRFPDHIPMGTRSRISEAYSLMLDQLCKIEMEEMQVKNATTETLADELQDRPDARTWCVGSGLGMTDALELISRQTAGETGPARIIIIQD